MSVTIYHNPRCSKSRATLELLREKNADPLIVEYLDTPPTIDELKQILLILGLGPRELIRKNEPPYKENRLDDPTIGDEALIRAMIENPVLIERPIVVKGDQAVIGRPPENVLMIL